MIYSSVPQNECFCNHSAILFYFHNGKLLRRKLRAFGKHGIPDACHLIAVQGTRFRHHGDAGAGFVQRHQTIDKALGLDQAFQLGGGGDAADLGGELFGQRGFLLLGKLGVLQCFFQGFQRLVARLVAR